jgi:hypothetical protein
MQDDIEEEIALALAIALSGKAKGEGAYTQRKHKSAWRRGLERKPHVAWTRTHGWKSAARHEGTRGR